MGYKTYSGIIKELKPNQIFVFGTNCGSSTGKRPTHGKGAAKIARDFFGAIQGQPRGLQGQSYGIVTKKYYDVEKSSTLYEIQQEVRKLYAFAKANPDKEFLIAQKAFGGLNGHTPDELARECFALVGIPDNIIFERNFARILIAYTL